MNHYLIFTAINDCFKEISSLDTGRLFSVYVSDDGITTMIKEEVIVHRLPEYYDQHKGNTEQFDIQQAIDEAVRRGYHATDLGIASTIEIDSLTFKLVKCTYADWAILCNEIIPRKPIKIPPMDADGLLDLMEDINDADICLKDHILKYLSLLGADFDISLNRETMYFSSLAPTASSAALYLYWGLYALPVYFQGQGMEPIDVLIEEKISAGIRADINPFLKDPETFIMRCAPIKEICKKNGLIEGIAEKHISEVLKKYSPKGIVGMSEVKYACYDSGVILLAPYRRKGVIIGFLDYSRMTALEETISRIMSYNEGSPLPEGFVLYE